MLALHFLMSLTSTKVFFSFQTRTIINMVSKRKCILIFWLYMIVSLIFYYPKLIKSVSFTYSIQFNYKIGNLFHDNWCSKNLFFIFFVFLHHLFFYFCKLCWVLSFDFETWNKLKCGATIYRSFQIQWY